MIRRKLKMYNDMLHAPLYGSYRTRTFSEVFPDANEFVEAYVNSGLYPSTVQIPTTSLTALYYLLYARYGNSHIASSDENQFKYKLYSVIFSYGPTWSKRLELQKKIRDLGDDWEDSVTIYNSALNDASDPTTRTKEEIDFINSQNTTRQLKSLPEKYSIIASLLETDVTEQFLGHFKKLFITFVNPELPLYYITED